MHHCLRKVGFLTALLSLTSPLLWAPGSLRERCWWTDLASPFKQILSILCMLPLDLSVWVGPLCQEAFYAGCPPWLQSGRAVPGEWQQLLPLTHFSQAIARHCQAGKPTKEPWWLPGAQIRSCLLVWGKKISTQRWGRWGKPKEAWTLTSLLALMAGSVPNAKLRVNS